MAWVDGHASSNTGNEMIANGTLAVFRDSAGNKLPL
jgi:hypothetical protein